MLKIQSNQIKKIIQQMIKKERNYCTLEGKNAENIKSNEITPTNMNYEISRKEYPIEQPYIKIVRDGRPNELIQIYLSKLDIEGSIGRLASGCSDEQVSIIESSIESIRVENDRKYYLEIEKCNRIIPINSICLKNIDNLHVNISDVMVCSLKIYNSGVFGSVSIVRGAKISELSINKCKFLGGQKLSVKNIEKLPESDLKPLITLKEIEFLSDSGLELANISKNLPIVIKGHNEYEKNERYIQLLNCNLSSVTVDVDDLSKLEFDMSNEFHVERFGWFNWFSVRTLFKNAVPHRNPLMVLLELILMGHDPYKPVVSPKKIDTHIKEFVRYKKEAKDRGDKRLEDDFLFGELTWERMKQSPNAINVMYWLTCGYGKSVAKPLAWMALVGLIASTIYWLLGQVEWYNSLGLAIEASLPMINNPVKTIYPEYKAAFPIDNLKYAGLLLAVYFQKAIQLFLLVEAGMAIRNAVKK